MFEIKIRQRSGTRRHALIKKTIKEVSSLIMRDNTLSSIRRVEVKVKKKLSGKNTIGTCHKKDSDIYEIEIKESLEKESFISTLAHEVAHINQFAEGRLESEPTAFIWNSLHYSTEDHTHEQYLAWPWEKEARSVEESYLNILKNRTLSKKSK